MAISIIISSLALVIAIVAVVMAVKNKKTVVKETTVKQEVIHAPVDHPFVYDEKVKAYRVNGSLYVTGFISALNIKKEG
jgi:hypothetical protein